MNTVVENVAPCRKKLSVETPADMVAAASKRILDQFVKSAEIPGFRKGKAPPQLVERKFASELAEATGDSLISETYRAALEKHGLTPLAIIDIERRPFEPGRPWRYSITLDVPPEFKLPKYKGISVRANKIEVSDEDVEKEITDIRFASASFFDAEPDYAAQRGDMAKITATAARADGAAAPEASELVRAFQGGETSWTLVGEGRFPPGLSAGLLGARAGETKTIETEICTNLPGLENLSGAKIIYTVTINALRRRTVPELNAEFLARLGVESEAALREKIRGSLLEQCQAAEKERLKAAIVAELLAKTALDIPETVWMEEARIVYRRAMRRAMLTCATPEEIEKQKEEMSQSAIQQAYVRTAQGYIFARIAEAEKITVEDAELEDYIKKLAVYYGLSFDEMKKEVERGHLAEEFRTDLLHEKVTDFLLQHAEISEGGFLRKMVGAIASKFEKEKPKQKEGEPR